MQVTSLVISIGIVLYGKKYGYLVKLDPCFFQVHQGLRVTVISTSADKKQEAIERFGVDSFLISREPEQMQATKSTLDGIIDTVSAVHLLMPLLSLLKTNGKLVLVGLLEKPLDLLAFPLIMGRKLVAGSGIAVIN
ncbi:hypothetical protein DM860_018152 [Cuscuta australis]|uniref:Alcohol dehydrogenase-like C-terminal domain-containing protein n=1 Tax=Cuscuta australis TaxID=267555 RepID=A0A328E0V9_9ASTE|nr:hypothetical protein DM860_018152 [Cuscuta australis]